MKSSILRDAINSVLAKKPSTEKELEWRAPGTSFYFPGSSSSKSTANNTETSSVASNISSRKNSDVPKEANLSTSNRKSRYIKLHVG